MTLTVTGVTCDYGGAPVVRDVSLRVERGRVLCVLGRNGAGKTTMLRAIMGLVPITAGSIALDDRVLTRLPAHTIPALGVAYIPQGRGLFPSFTVEENLRMGLLVQPRAEDPRPWIYELFPLVRERLRQRAGTLSGGEQQMVATARALCANPSCLLMDEPTEGLMPLLADRLMDAVRTLRDRGVGILLVEQRVDAALAVADDAVILETGEVRYQGPAHDLGPELLAQHLGVSR